MQTFPVAITCGNTFILKPSEKNPGDYRNITVSIVSYVLALIFGKFHEVRCFSQTLSFFIPFPCMNMVTGSSKDGS